ncbi:MAG TPA: hypothetical protein VJU16_07010 [Planctomycetota bacterium]|nr:hypothetical protein [Planctomycetota bacterium]
MNGRRRDVETRYRVLRRQQRWQMARLMVLVIGITVVAIWWMATHMRNC